MSDYPSDRKNTGFAIRYLKWLVDSGSTLDIGPEAVSVLVAVVLMEDQFHYQRAVNFYNEQLVSRAGFRNVKTMDRARSKAVKAGLLHYVSSTKRERGIYWVLTNDSLLLSKNYQGNGRITGGKREDSGVPPYQVLPSTPNRPSITKTLSSEADAHSPELLGWIEWWNGLHTKELVSSGTSKTPSKAVLKAWDAVQKSSELKELLSGRAAIEKAIRESDFVRGGWFRLEKLLAGKNKAGEFITRMLLDGGYASKSKPKVNVGPGVNFDPTRSYADASF
jgi:hypothetical protein